MSGPPFHDGPLLPHMPPYFGPRDRPNFEGFGGKNFGRMDMYRNLENGAISTKRFICSKIINNHIFRLRRS
ncbi:hypothetical protein CDAR_208261 [Caerostris darwini]|uniref:Uncharacterized protein n=1 Tax=Caerostris darwini TaxID=1538125 RepID=A0AAV4REI9_9ARAC|nr:hypothetical protein CDAR_208261 [Caerostris darwini]